MEKFIPLLSKKVKKSDFDREKQRLQDELLDPSFFDRLRSQLLSQQDWIYPNFAELLDYQEKRYKNYWIVDENYNILQEGDWIDCDSTQQLSSRRVTFDTIDYFLLAIPFESAKDWYLFDFCQRLSQAWIDYQTRYVEKLYFPYQFYNSLRSEAWYLIYAKGAYEQMKVLDQKFFDTFKNFYLQKLISNKGNLLAQLLNKKTEKPESVISDILYSQVQQFFSWNLY